MPNFDDIALGHGPSETTLIYDIQLAYDDKTPLATRHPQVQDDWKLEKFEATDDESISLVRYMALNDNKLQRCDHKWQCSRRFTSENGSWTIWETVEHQNCNGTSSKMTLSCQHKSTWTVHAKLMMQLSGVANTRNWTLTPGARLHIFNWQNVRVCRDCNKIMTQQQVRIAIQFGARASELIITMVERDGRNMRFIAPFQVQFLWNVTLWKYLEATEGGQRVLRSGWTDWSLVDEKRADVISPEKGVCKTMSEAYTPDRPSQVLYRTRKQTL